MGHAVRLSLPRLLSACSSSAGFCSISSCFCREDLLAENVTNPLKRALPDGIVPEDEVTRTEAERRPSLSLGAYLASLFSTVISRAALHWISGAQFAGGLASPQMMVRHPSHSRRRARRRGLPGRQRCPYLYLLVYRSVRSNLPGRGTVRTEYESVKTDFLLQTSVGAYATTGHWWRRYYWYCHL